MLHATTGLLLWRTGVRIWFSSRVYGAKFALAVPVRVLHANLINSVAAAAALARFARAKWRGEPLRWVKTAHNYPSRDALREHKRSLRDVLIGGAYLEEAELCAALARKPADTELCDYLLSCGLLSEDDLVEVLSLQDGVPIVQLEPADIPPRTGRALPARVALQWSVLPFRIENGNLHLAGPRLPGDAVQEELRRFTSLRVRFHLVTRTEWEELARQWL
jgi:hypothetical protein